MSSPDTMGAIRKGEEDIKNGNAIAQNEGESIDDFLSFNRYDILPHKGKISREQAAQRAVEVYQAYNKQQKITSDFDKAVKRIQGNKNGKK